jgi:DNA-binding transcriptional LysR family regulator
MDINFELYKIFYYTVSSGSFSGAAEKLFITQSAVSQAIKNLETKLGVTLFFRKTRNLKLTPEGEMLFTHIEQAYNFIKAGEQKLAETQNLDSGEIRIGASDTVCKYFLLPYLESFHRLYPKVKIQFINRTSPKILENLKNGAVDFAVVTLPINDKSINVRELKVVTDIFVAAPKYAELKDHRIKLADLADYPLLLLEKASSTRRNFDAFLRQNQITLFPEIELESVDLLVEFARIGLGVAHVLKESAQAPIERGELFEVEVEEKMPQRKLGLATMAQVPLSKAAEVFVSLL